MVGLILDTNIWIAYVARDENLLNQLIDKREKGEIGLLSNEIILEEWYRNKEKTIKKISTEIKSHFDSAKVIVEYLKEPEKQIYIDTITPMLAKEQQQLEFARKRVEEVEELLKSCTMTPITDEMRIKVTDWALKKRAPFKNKANSVGDALILLSSADYWTQFTTGTTDSIFVSFNHTDYADKENIDEIDNDLRDILDAANMIYIRNIGEALKKTPILNDGVMELLDALLSQKILDFEEFINSKEYFEINNSDFDEHELAAIQELEERKTGHQEINNSDFDEHELAAIQELEERKTIIENED